jgi:hypothetical protein
MPKKRVMPDGAVLPILRVAELARLQTLVMLNVAAVGSLH